MNLIYLFVRVSIQYGCRTVEIMVLVHVETILTIDKPTLRIQLRRIVKLSDATCTYHLAFIHRFGPPNG